MKKLKHFLLDLKNNPTRSERYLIASLLIVTFLAIGATFWATTNTHGKAIYYIYGTSFLILVWTSLAFIKLKRLWVEKKRGMRGSKLHIQLVILFFLAAILPAVAISSFSGVLFEISMKSWFSKPVEDAVTQADEVAQAYLREHISSIRTEALLITKDILPILPSLIESQNLSKILTDIADRVNLSEILIFDKSSNVIGKSFLTFSLEFQKITMKDFLAARNGEIVVQKSPGHVRALALIDPNNGLYLMIGRPISSEVLEHIDLTKAAVKEYKSLLGTQSDLKTSFIILFIFMAMLLIAVAAWGGLWLANMLFTPISRLINAAHEVSEGNLDVTITQEKLNNDFDTLVESFNHMTSRLKAQNEEISISQRKAAWSDVARKIAHEIKNPLTPIHLSAERLKRKYKEKLEDADQKSFINYVDTIIRHVDIIGNLVKEFSDFARMPQALRKPENLSKIIRDTLKLQQQAFPKIDIKFIERTSDDVIFSCDTQQMTQLITNLVQNSVQAMKEAKDQVFPMTTQVTIYKNTPDNIIVTVEDNGPGFPKSNRTRMLEPYFTTREKGTGLGLAIVSTITSEHGGTMQFNDSSLGGAKVVLEFKSKDDKKSSIDTHGS